MAKYGASPALKKGPSQRQLRVGEEIRHALADIFMRGEVVDPDLNTPITVSEVRISPDLKNATAYVMPLGGLNRELILTALERNAGIIRTLVIDKIILRHAPRINFKLDYSYDEAAKIDRLLKGKPVGDEGAEE